MDRPALTAASLIEGPCAQVSPRARS